MAVSTLIKGTSGALVFRLVELLGVKLKENKIYTIFICQIKSCSAGCFVRILESACTTVNLIYGGTTRRRLHFAGIGAVLDDRCTKCPKLRLILNHHQSFCLHRH